MPRSEDLFADDVATELRARLAEVLAQASLVVETRTKVVTDLTVDPDQSVGHEQYCPSLNCLEQDIVIGKRLPVPAAIRPYFYNVGQRSSGLIPRVVIEVKYQGVGSPAIMSASDVAGRIKSVYMDVKCYFLMRAGAKDAWTLARHGTHFDRMYQLAHCHGNNDPQWPGAYEVGDLDEHLLDQQLSDRFDQFVQDLEDDLASPRVRTT